MPTAINDPFLGVKLDIRRNSGRYHVLRSHGLWRYEARYVFPPNGRFKPGYESVPSLVGYGRDQDAAILSLARQVLKLQEANGDMASTASSVITIDPANTAVSNNPVITFTL